MIQKIEIEYELLDHSGLLNEADQAVLEAARAATKTAYAPYSHFQVGAAARLTSDQIIIGSNQESSSYPVGICAERTLLNSIGSQFPAEKVTTIAVSYEPVGKASNEPISPCGMCRQSLLDYENRYESPIRVILAGLEGKVMVFSSVGQLLPFGFNGSIFRKQA
jgi:cytidine deaminase